MGFIMQPFPTTPLIKEHCGRMKLVVQSSLSSLDAGMKQGWKVNAETFRLPRTPLDVYIPG